jgi:Bacterial Ig domain
MRGCNIKTPTSLKFLIPFIQLVVICFVLFVLLLPPAVSAQSDATLVEQIGHQDPAGGGGGLGGFGRNHWITSINKMVSIFGQGPSSGDNSIRVYDPVTDTWTYVFGGDVNNAPQNRDNHYSLYIPALDEYWIWGGSHLEALPPLGITPYFAGRFGPFAGGSPTWITKATCLPAGCETGNGGDLGSTAFSAVVDMSAIGGNMPNTGTDPATAWSASLNMGIVCCGSSGGNPTKRFFVIEPKPGGPQPYKTRRIQDADVPFPVRDQMMNGAAFCGTKFYIWAGQSHNGVNYISTDDLWEFNPAGNSGLGSFTQLASPPNYYVSGPSPLYQAVMVCDPDADRLLVQTQDKVFSYSITNNQWSDTTPPNMPCILGPMGVYAPTVKRLLIQGGLYCSTQSGTYKTYSISAFYVKDGTTDQASAASQVSTTAAPTTPPPPPPPPALASTLKALDLGVTGEDKVGQNNQTTPNGKPDFHLSVSGLRGTPNKVTITSDIGIWETPFNGKNWIIATQYDGKGNGDFWFEQFASNTFHVKVRYVDGTTDEADASKQAASTAVTAAVAPPPTTPAATSNPTSTSGPTGQFDIPLRTWIARPYANLPTGAPGNPHNVPGAKHMNLAVNTDTGKLYITGGDSINDQGLGDNTGVWSYHIPTDVWTMEYPHCGFFGDIMPGGANESGFVYDSTRHRFVLQPGFWFLNQSGPAGCGAQTTWNPVANPSIVISGEPYFHVTGPGVRSFPTNHGGSDFSVKENTPSAGQRTLTNLGGMTASGTLYYQPDNAAYQITTDMAFDPIAKKWSVPGFPCRPGQFGECIATQAPKNGFYDPVTDRIFRVGTDYRGVAWYIYKLSDNTAGSAPTFLPNSGDLQFEWIAGDPVSRKMWLIDPNNYTFWQFDMDALIRCETTPGTNCAAAVSQKASPPTPPYGPFSPNNNYPVDTLCQNSTGRLQDFTQPVYDPINNVVFYPWICSLSDSRPVLFIYHPNTDTWETDAMFQPDGKTVRGNLFMFDKINNVLISYGGLCRSDIAPECGLQYGAGGADPSLTHFFIYRYGNGDGKPYTPPSTPIVVAPPPPPSVVVTPQPASTLKAINLGVTGEDKVGESNQTTSNGKADFHISVSGLRSTPSRVTITSDTGGIWETPFNGQNWIIATQYDGQGNGHFWFEQFASKNFHVKVRYSDGTTDDADAINQTSTLPTVPPPPTQQPTTLKAINLGITGEDKVGQMNQTTPNGKADFHISVSGLRSTPSKVTITSDTGGIWETPFNGQNWIIATQYDGQGNGHFWFEQYPSKGFHVKVRYADGTTDEADASKQRSALQSQPAVAATIPDTTPPSVSFTYPSTGATVSGAISVSISASDNVAISKVELYKDAVLVGSTTNSLSSFPWDSTKDRNGFHTLIAMAYDSSANRTSTIISVTVNNGASSNSTAVATHDRSEPKAKVDDRLHQTKTIGR